MVSSSLVIARPLSPPQMLFFQPGLSNVSGGFRVRRSNLIDEILAVITDIVGNRLDT